MRNKVLSIFSAAVLVLALGSMAKADTYNLTQQNGGLGTYSPASDYATVTLVLNGGTLGDGATCAAGAGGVCIDFQATSGWIFHNGGVGWDQNITTGTLGTETITTCAAVGGATCSFGGSGNFDGFGSMTNSVAGGTGSSSGLTDVVITITGTGLTLGDFENSNGTKDNTTFAAQLSPYPNSNPSSCTGFIGDSGSSVGMSGATASSTVCGVGGQVPEPGSLALFGTGILGMAGYLRRKLLS